MPHKSEHNYDEHSVYVTANVAVGTVEARITTLTGWIQTLIIMEPADALALAAELVAAATTVSPAGPFMPNHLPRCCDSYTETISVGWPGHCASCGWTRTIHETVALQRVLAVDDTLSPAEDAAYMDTYNERWDG